MHPRPLKLASNKKNKEDAVIPPPKSKVQQAAVAATPSPRPRMRTREFGWGRETRRPRGGRRRTPIDRAYHQSKKAIHSGERTVQHVIKAGEQLTDGIFVETPQRRWLYRDSTNPQQAAQAEATHHALVARMRAIAAERNVSQDEKEWHIEGAAHPASEAADQLSGHVNNKKAGKAGALPNIDVPLSAGGGVPTAYANAFTQRFPHVAYGSDGSSIRVRHAELIDTLSSAKILGAYEADSFAINPGLAYLPWLSRLARGFTNWRIGSTWTLHYISRVGTNAEGTVMLARDPVAGNPLPSGETAFMSLVGSTQFQPWTPRAHVVIRPVDTPGGSKYVRLEAKAGGQALYDDGQVLYGTIGCDTGFKPLGKLMMEYDVILEFPTGDPDRRDYGLTTTVLVGIVAASIVVPVSPGARLGFKYSVDPTGAVVNPLQLAFPLAAAPSTAFSLPTGYYRFHFSCALLTNASFAGNLVTCRINRFYSTPSNPNSIASPSFTLGAPLGGAVTVEHVVNFYVSAVDIFSVEIIALGVGLSIPSESALIPTGLYPFGPMFLTITLLE